MIFCGGGGGGDVNINQLRLERRAGGRVVGLSSRRYTYIYIPYVIDHTHSFIHSLTFPPLPQSLFVGFFYLYLGHFISFLDGVVSRRRRSRGGDY